MPSTNKTPHGLNQWLLGDEPKMEDFNADNAAIEEEVVWKSDIDSGSNENGNWIKFPDGTMICSKAMQENINSSSAFGALYITPQVQLGEWASQFTSPPVRTVTLDVISGGNPIPVGGTLPNATSAGGIYIGTAGQGSGAVGINIIGIGRWK